MRRRKEKKKAKNKKKNKNGWKINKQDTKKNKIYMKNLTKI